MANGVITGMAVVIGNFILSPTLIGIIVLILFLLALIGIMVFLGRKMRRVKAEKQAAVQREIERQREIEKQKEMERIVQSRAAKNVFKREPDKIDWKSLTSEQRELFGKALRVMKDARRGGFSDLEIRNMFRERGWRDKDVDKLIDEIRHER